MGRKNLNSIDQSRHFSFNAVHLYTVGWVTGKDLACKICAAIIPQRSVLRTKPNVKQFQKRPVKTRASAVAEMGDHARANWADKWEAVVPLLWRSWVPIEHMLPGPRLTSVPSGILIHLAVWPQQT